MGGAVLDVDRVRATFDRVRPLTVGIEEEVLLVDPRTGLPAPVAAAVVAEGEDARIKPELPACQVELATTVHDSVTAAVDELGELRTLLSTACGEEVRPAAAAVHPLVGRTPVAQADRARALVERYGEVAQRQLVGALQVHVAVGGADATLAVHNALRGHLPELAALAASAPFHLGHDTGLASVRPLIATQLPRQGVPPAIESWADHVDDLRWGARGGGVPEPGWWWWELRPHLRFGTLEVRVPDVQVTLEAAGAVAAVVHALVSALRADHLDGRELGSAPTWRIAENRWQALHHGVHGTLADLRTGEPQPTATRLHELLDRVEDHAPSGLEAARGLVERNGADALREIGVERAVPWMVERFAPG
jgi:carboxylate-amine ligase